MQDFVSVVFVECPRGGGLLCAVLGLRFNGEIWVTRFDQVPGC